jgi:hypothetical protein
MVPLATKVLKGNLAKRKEVSRSEAEMDIDDNQPERVVGRPSKAPRIISPPKSLMHSRHGELAVKVRSEHREEDGRAQARKLELLKMSKSGWTEVKRKEPRGAGAKATKIEDGRGCTLVWDTPTRRYEIWHHHRRKPPQQ